ncbi:unnamed protein product [Sphacelaria rigidula]
MGNVCRPTKHRDIAPQNIKTIRIPCEEFPSHNKVLDDYVFDDNVLENYIRGENDVAKMLTEAGSSFLAKRRGSDDAFPESPPQLEPMYFRGAVALPSDSFSMSDSDSMSYSKSIPSLSSRKSHDRSFFKNFGFNIQNPRPYPFCFRNNKIPRGSSRCFDSDAGSHASYSSESNILSLVLNTPPSYKNANFYCSPLSSPFPTPSQPPTPIVHKTFWTNMDDRDSEYSSASNGSQDFDKTKWIWDPRDAQPRAPPPKHPQVTPIVSETKKP